MSANRAYDFEGAIESAVLSVMQANGINAVRSESTGTNAPECVRVVFELGSVVGDRVAPNEAATYEYTSFEGTLRVDIVNKRHSSNTIPVAPALTRHREMICLVRRILARGQPDISALLPLHEISQLMHTSSSMDADDDDYQVTTMTYSCIVSILPTGFAGGV